MSAGVRGAGRGIKPLLIELSHSTGHISDGPLIAQVDDEENNERRNDKILFSGRGVGSEKGSSKKEVITPLRTSQSRRKSNITQLMYQLKFEGLLEGMEEDLSGIENKFFQSGRNVKEHRGAKQEVLLSWPERTGLPPLWPEPKHPLTRGRKKTSGTLAESQQPPRKIQSRSFAGEDDAGDEAEEAETKKDGVISKIMQLLSELKGESERSKGLEFEP